MVVEIIAKIPHWWFFKVICVYQVCLLRCWMNLFFWLNFQNSWRKCILFQETNRFVLPWFYVILGPWDPELSQSVCTQKWDGFLCSWTCLHPRRWTCCTSFPWRWKGSDPFSTFLFMSPMAGSGELQPNIIFQGWKTSVLPCDVSFWGIRLRKPIIPMAPGWLGLGPAGHGHCLKDCEACAPSPHPFNCDAGDFFFWGDRLVFLGDVFFLTGSSQKLDWWF